MKLHFVIAILFLSTNVEFASNAIDGYPDAGDSSKNLVSINNIFKLMDSGDNKQAYTEIQTFVNQGDCTVKEVCRAVDVLLLRMYAFRDNRMNLLNSLVNLALNSTANEKHVNDITHLGCRMLRMGLLREPIETYYRDLDTKKLLTMAGELAKKAYGAAINDTQRYDVWEKFVLVRGWNLPKEQDLWLQMHGILRNEELKQPKLLKAKDITQDARATGGIAHSPRKVHRTEGQSPA